MARSPCAVRTALSFSLAFSSLGLLGLLKVESAPSRRARLHQPLQAGLAFNSPQLSKSTLMGRVALCNPPKAHWIREREASIPPSAL